MDNKSELKSLINKQIREANKLLKLLDDLYEDDLDKIDEEFTIWKDYTFDLLKEYFNEEEAKKFKNSVTRPSVLDSIELFESPIKSGITSLKSVRERIDFLILKTQNSKIDVEEIETKDNFLEQLENLLANMIYIQVISNPEIYANDSRYITNQRKKTVKNRDNYLCQICGNEFTENELVTDHIYPYSLGGSNFPINLMALCKECNINKNARLVYFRSKEGKQKIKLNIADFVRNLPILTSFGKWIEEMSQYRRKDDKIE